MKYNPKSKLDMSQFRFERRSRANHGSRFDDMERSHNTNLRRSAIQKRMRGYRIPS